MPLKSYIKESVRYAYIILFLYAAFSQLLDHSKFHNDLQNSPVFGNSQLAEIVSWMVPILELVLAAFLLSNNFRRAAIGYAMGLLLLFSLYISGILLFSSNIPCSCGGIINIFTWEQHLIFNFCFILLGALGLYLQSKKRFIK